VLEFADRHGKVVGEVSPTAVVEVDDADLVAVKEVVPLVEVSVNQSVGVRSKAEEILGSSDPLKHRGHDRTTARVKIIDKIPGGGNDRWPTGSRLGCGGVR
jgi:hypothetical protein